MAQVVLVILILAQLSSANTEVDDLAAQFGSSFGSIVGKLGSSATYDGPMDIYGAERRMRDLYSAMEKNLMEARQRAANSRSHLTADVIEKLRLVWIAMSSY